MENFAQVWREWKREFARGGSDLRKLMQRGLVNAIQQFGEHGNANYLTEAVKLGHAAGYNTNQLMGFVTEHASVEWTGGKFRQGEGERSAKVPTMLWWKFKKTPIPKEFDMNKRIKAMCKQARTAITEKRFKGSIEQVTALEAIVNQ